MHQLYPTKGPFEFFQNIPNTQLRDAFFMHTQELFILLWGVFLLCFELLFFLMCLMFFFCFLRFGDQQQRKRPRREDQEGR